MSENFKKLVSLVRDIYDLRFARAVLDWDMNTYMPPKGAEARSRQLSILAEIAHKKLSEKQLGQLIDECMQDTALTARQKALLREIKRDREKAIKVPASLVREITDVKGQAYNIWVKARKNSQFKAFAPILSRILELKKQEAAALGFGNGVPYDALIDEFEPGATVATLTPVLTQMRNITVDALQAIQSSKRKPKVQIVERRFPVEIQEKFAVLAATRMGYDFEAGRMDRTTHPFCTNFDVQDVRITTRYNDRYFNDAFFSVVHEAGHALYEQGFLKADAATPLAEAVSMGIHESQSRIWENQISRSLPYWKFFFPKARAHFPTSLKGVKLEDFHFAINAVNPSLIRVDADEVTYNLHVALRYEIEQALFSGDISANELPAIWNDKMKSYLGLKPKRDAEGVLQDVHWSLGLFGYFPSYSLGNLYASQWMACMKRDIRGLDRKIAKGNLAPIKKWLNEKIHHHGREFSATELVLNVTGETLNPKYFEEYLKSKYGALYGVNW